MHKKVNQPTPPNWKNLQNKAFFVTNFNIKLYPFITFHHQLTFKFMSKIILRY